MLRVLNDLLLLNNVASPCDFTDQRAEIRVAKICYRHSYADMIENERLRAAAAAPPGADFNMHFVLNYFFFQK